MLSLIKSLTKFDEILMICDCSLYAVNTLESTARLIGHKKSRLSNLFALSAFTIYSKGKKSNVQVRLTLAANFAARV